MTKTPVEESSAYDNYLGQTSVPLEPEEETSLADFLGMEDEEGEREKLWVGMPEFVQKDNPPFKTIYLHFRNEQDYNEFVAKYKTVDEDQFLSKKTKSMWYPHLDKDENSLKRWFEE
jgi:hypothetical protein